MIEKETGTVQRSQEYASPVTSRQRDLAAWKALPRLLVSRRWRWVTLGVVALALIMLRLGFWQLDRLHERRTENALIEARLAAPPIEITGQSLDPVTSEYRRAVVSGTFDNEQSVLLRNRSRNGVPGMHLLTPLHITGSDQAVLVDRGWLPMELTQTEAWRQFEQAGNVEITGIIRAPRTSTNRFGPQDRVPENGWLDAWYRPDIARIDRQIPYDLLPFYVEIDQPAAQPTDLPQPDPQLDLGEGSHLGYAIQWFAFTVTLLVGYAALVVTRSRTEG